MTSHNRILLRHEVDTSQSVKAADDLEQSWVSAHLGMGRAADSTTSSLRKMQIAATASIGAITAGAAAAQGSWLTVGTTVLASFAAGGPIAGAVALAGAAVGVLISQGDDIEQQYARQIQSMVGNTSSLTSEVTRLDRELMRARGVDLLRHDVDEAQVAMHAATNEVIKFEQALTRAKKNEEDAPFLSNIPGDLANLARFVSFGLIDIRSKGGIASVDGGKQLGVGDLEDHIVELQKIETEAKKSFDLLAEKMDKSGSINDIIATRATTAAGKAADAQLEVLRSRTELDRFQAQLSAQLDQQKRAGLDNDHVSRLQFAATQGFFAQKGDTAKEQLIVMQQQFDLLNAVNDKERARLQINIDLFNQLRAFEVDESAPVEIQRQFEELRASARGIAGKRVQNLDGFGELDRITAQIGPQISGAIAQAGATGFKSWEGAAQQVASSIQGMLLNAVVSSGLFNLLGGATGGGAALFGQNFIPLFGDGAIVTRPTLAIVGEKGPEEIRPLNKPSMLRGGDTFNIPITVQNGDGQTIQRLEGMIDRIIQRRRRQFRGRLGPGL